MPVALSTPKVDQYELARKRAEQRANAVQQQSSDAMKRRFAAMGALNSGAAIKAQQNAATEINAQKEDAIQGIEAAQAQEMQRRQEMQEQMKFQAEEAEKGRTFQGGMQERQFGFQSSMAEKEMGFRSGETEKQRGFEGTQAKLNRAQQEWAVKLQNSTALKQMEQQNEQFKQQIGLETTRVEQEQQAMLYNMATAALEADDMEEFWSTLDQIRQRYGKPAANRPGVAPAGGGQPLMPLAAGPR